MAGSITRHKSALESIKSREAARSCGGGSGPREDPPNRKFPRAKVNGKKRGRRGGRKKRKSRGHFLRRRGKGAPSSNSLGADLRGPARVRAAPASRNFSPGPAGADFSLNEAARRSLARARLHPGPIQLEPRTLCRPLPSLPRALPPRALAAGKRGARRSRGESRRAVCTGGAPCLCLLREGTGLSAPAKAGGEGDSVCDGANFY